MPDERGIVSKSKLTALATAIKTKAGASGTYSLDDLVDVVDDIETGGVTPTGTKQVSITQNGTTTEDVTNYASAEITVDVPTSGITPSGTIQITENGTVDVTQYASAAVNVSGGGGELEIRGDYNIETFAGLSNPVKLKIVTTEKVFICKVTLANSAIGKVTLDFSSDDGSAKSFSAVGSSFSTGTTAGCLQKIASSDGTASLYIGSVSQVFRYQSSLEEIDVPVTTLSATSADRTFANCYALKKINFVEEGCRMPLLLPNSNALTNEGLILIANGMRTGEPKTLTLHATPKAKLSNILGTVTIKMRSDEVEYGFFTADESGTVTLLDFITNTKGWTVA